MTQKWRINKILQLLTGAGSGYFLDQLVTQKGRVEKKVFEQVFFFFSRQSASLRHFFSESLINKGLDNYINPSFTVILRH